MALHVSRLEYTTDTGKRSVVLFEGSQQDVLLRFNDEVKYVHAQPGWHITGSDHTVVCRRCGGAGAVPGRVAGRFQVKPCPDCQ